MSEQVKQLLTDARDLIQEHGWVQQKIGSTGEGFCTLGAVVRAGRAYLPGAAADALDRVERVVGRGVVLWNDAEGRTQEEVVEALELAIESA